MFRIVHRFHPHRNRPLAIVTTRRNWGEQLVYYHNPQGRLVSVPARWTDRVSPDPSVALSAGRSPFRLEDLLELGRLLASLGKEPGDVR